MNDRLADAVLGEAVIRRPIKTRAVRLVFTKEQRLCPLDVPPVLRVVGVRRAHLSRALSAAVRAHAAGTRSVAELVTLVEDTIRPHAEIDYVSCERHGDTLHVAGVWGATGSRVAAGTWKTGNLLRILERDAAGQWVASYEIWN